MIITRQKLIKEILSSLTGSKNIFLVGCAQCATLCKTGGEEELIKMEKELGAEGKTITGKSIIDPACHLIKVKQFFQKNKKGVLKSDAIVAMTCGDGVQSIADGTKDTSVKPALDSLFLGEIQRGGHFVQKCILCGECIIDKTGGICPVTICTKGLLNGPCGGSKNEKCEVDRERDCGWILIYKRLKDRGELDKMKNISDPQDYSKQIKPQKVVL
ncbi:MAG: methylenetetrahydrofolate reductase C-terminal domain-containing protein [Candidatus Omnitrophica bacterium]|nr:methylenetetrahydrofolate reductase C-terminal domain-containing protein [Candidatus Omnitrophota bacterium]